MNFLTTTDFPLLGVFYPFIIKTVSMENAVYTISKLEKPIKIDGNWNKSQWREVKPIDISLYMGKIPSFLPVTQAKMLYDENNVYIIFQVHDRYICSMVTEYNGPVSNDACVEFFFSPDKALPERYFNLEVNSGGIPLMGYHIDRRVDYKLLEHADLDQIEIAHSLPGRLENEITEPVTWAIEYKVPLSVLKKFSDVSHPGPGVIWRANFYKTASKGSNPHYITWALVDNVNPDFHLPQFFGTLRFK